MNAAELLERLGEQAPLDQAAAAARELDLPDETIASITSELEGHLNDTAPSTRILNITTGLVVAIHKPGFQDVKTLGALGRCLQQLERNVASKTCLRLTRCFAQHPLVSQHFPDAVSKHLQTLAHNVRQDTSIEEFYEHVPHDPAKWAAALDWAKARTIDPEAIREGLNNPDLRLAYGSLILAAATAGATQYRAASLLEVAIQAKPVSRVSDEWLQHALHCLCVGNYIERKAADILWEATCSMWARRRLGVSHGRELLDAAKQLRRGATTLLDAAGSLAARLTDQAALPALMRLPEGPDHWPEALVISCYNPSQDADEVLRKHLVGLAAVPEEHWGRVEWALERIAECPGLEQPGVSHLVAAALEFHQGGLGPIARLMLKVIERIDPSLPEMQGLANQIKILRLGCARDAGTFDTGTLLGKLREMDQTGWSALDQVVWRNTIKAAIESQRPAKEPCTSEEGEAASTA